MITANIAKAIETANTPLLIITQDTADANRLRDELPFFTDAPLKVFPDWETLPYDHFSPHQDIISERLAALYQIPHLKCGAILVAASTLLSRLCPKEYLSAHFFLLKVGDTLSIEKTRQQLEKAGYRAVNQVREHGEFAVRGALLDLFPMGTENPFRIDLCDEEIDSIRTFSKDTQRSLEKVDVINLMPAKEFPLHEESIDLFRARFREK